MIRYHINKVLLFIVLYKIMTAKKIFFSNFRFMVLLMYHYYPLLIIISNKIFWKEKSLYFSTFNCTFFFFLTAF